MSFKSACAVALFTVGAATALAAPAAADEQTRSAVPGGARRARRIGGQRRQGDRHGPVDVPQAG